MPGAGPAAFLPSSRARARLHDVVRVGPTHVGRGVFARRPLPSGIVLGEIRGTILEHSPEDPSYVMELPSGRVLDPVEPLRFMNHCFDPNFEIFFWECSARSSIALGRE